MGADGQYQRFGALAVRIVSWYSTMAKFFTCMTAVFDLPEVERATCRGEYAGVTGTCKKSAQAEDDAGEGHTQDRDQRSNPPLTRCSS